MELIVNNGKPVEPSKLEKVKAAVTRDTTAVVTLDRHDVQQLVVDRLWSVTPWLSKYEAAGIAYDTANNTFTITFYTRNPVK